MQLTPNFRLMKPDGTDPVNVQDLNDNMDVLDAEVVKKLDKTGDASNVVNKFTQAGSRTNLLSGEKLSVSFGKIMKWFVDLKDVAFSGRYSDLTDRPTIPAGGIADKSKIIDNLDDIAANTQTGYMAGALAVKELNQNLGNINGLLPSGITNLADLLKYWISNGYLSDPNLRALVPFLTGNDSRIIHNSSNTNYQMWQVYDNNMVTAGIGATYIGFDFGSAICVRRIEWKGFNSAYTGFGKNSHVQGSVDGTSWVNVYEFDGGNSYGARMINAFANSQSYRYWRVQNGTGAIVGLAFLQFYGV